jgi:hypothetical protein
MLAKGRQAGNRNEKSGIKKGDVKASSCKVISNV